MMVMYYFQRCLYLASLRSLWCYSMFVCFFHGMKTPLGVCKGEGDEEEIMLNYSLNGLEGDQGNY